MTILRLNLGHELVVDNFAGGGGASTGIEMALGRAVDCAINHDPEAVAMHTANHPCTAHYCESVYAVDPVAITRNQPVGLAWFSPDCKHFSKAKGGKPVSKKIRGLAWVVIRWAKRVRPRVIMLENVEEFQDWGPVNEDGQPCPLRKGQTFRQFVGELEKRGYKVETRELRACDYGAPTIRKRLFMIARRDGLPIVWPKPTHGDPRSDAVKRGKLQPWRNAAECIDWSIPAPSIFERARPLADATCRRIAKGIMRYVVNAQKPFIVPIAHYNGRDLVHSIEDPLRTITANQKGGAFALRVPTLVQTGYGERAGQSPRVPGLEKPLGTIVASQKHALVAAFLAKHYTGVVGSDLRDPMGTVTSVDHHSPVTANLEPAGHSDKVHAFLVKYYGNEQDGIPVDEPLHTIPTRDRFGLVTVHGEPYRIVDIGLRMLTPRELATAQGFPEDYILEDVAPGIRLTKTAQIRMIGNSVCPPLSAALVQSNFAHETRCM